MRAILFIIYFFKLHKKEFRNIQKNEVFKFDKIQIEEMEMTFECSLILLVLVQCSGEQLSAAPAIPQALCGEAAAAAAAARCRKVLL